MTQKLFDRMKLSIDFLPVAIISGLVYTKLQDLYDKKDELLAERALKTTDNRKKVIGDTEINDQVLISSFLAPRPSEVKDHVFESLWLEHGEYYSKAEIEGLLDDYYQRNPETGDDSSDDSREDGSEESSDNTDIFAE